MLIKQNEVLTDSSLSGFFSFVLLNILRLGRQTSSGPGRKQQLQLGQRNQLIQ